MEMYNADGSRGEMCGNGIRCVGKYVFESGRARRNPLRVDSDAGTKRLDLHLRDGRVESVTVDMDAPILDGPKIPVTAESQVIDAPLRVGERDWRITCLSMGNPHCVVFLDDVAGLDLERLGPTFEHHPFFPERVNTEFVRVVSPRELIMRVWERGSGETAACGTGACAVLVAAVLNRHAERRATVHLNGGDLEIEWRESDGHVLMTGPAEEVYRGTFEVR
jgi:diaminopimelate epimerase